MILYDLLKQYHILP